MKKIIMPLGILFGMSLQVYSQQVLQKNEFKVGMWGFRHAVTAPYFITSGPGGPQAVTATTFVPSGNPTSQLNQMVADGFNIFSDYVPDLYGGTSEEFIESYIELVKNHNAQLVLFANAFYRPDASCNNTIIGTNVYDNFYDSSPNKNQPWYNYKVRPDWNSIIDNVAADPLYSSTIWGWHMTGEGAFYHQYNKSSTMVPHDSLPENCNVEVPPLKVDEAITYFRNRLITAGLPAGKQKMISSIACHSCVIHSGVTFDGEGIYEPHEYVHLASNPDALFEASYYQYPTNWLNFNYSNLTNDYPNYAHPLAKYRNIDYMKSYNTNVYAEISTELAPGYPEYYRHFHSNTSILNCNWLWHQTYNSIIHGVKGTFFWGIGALWEQTPTDLANQNYMYNGSSSDRYLLNRFPKYYQDYVRFLGQELRYLVAKNILSTDPNTVLYKKTDQTDPNCGVVGDPTSYTNYVPSDFLTNSIYSEKRSANYGLRYTIRTNGNETIVIISNQLNASFNATLNFGNLADPIIRSSTGVEFLFEQTVPTMAICTTSTYKTNRNAGINWSAGTVTWHPYQAYSSGKLITVAFGPLDTHILKFVSSPTSYANGWIKEWSNFGSGNIDGWTVLTTDEFVPGDFDGDGSEELLCIGKTAGTADWATMLKYKDNGNGGYDWDWHWSNYGSDKIGTWTLATNSRFVVGDFTGDGKDELFCIQALSSNAMATMFTYNTSTNSWDCIWTNGTTVPACNLHGPLGTIDGWSILSSDKFVVGDFDADSREELLCIQNSNVNAWATILNYDVTNDWNWGWSNSGNGTIGGWGILAMDQYEAGDMNNDGKKDELFCVQKGGNWGSIYKNSTGSSWTFVYSNNGLGGIAGWGQPVRADDKIMLGNVDGDGKDELMFIQTCSGCGWATTEDLNTTTNQMTWNWSNNTWPYPSGWFDYINDWKVNDAGGTNVNYMLIKARASDPKYLMAFRKFGCNDYLVNMYKSTSGTNKSTLAEMEPNIREIQVYPNPNDGHFTVQIDNVDFNSLRIEVLSLVGSIIHSQSLTAVKDQGPLKIDLNVAEVSSGTYIVKFTDDKNNVSTKLINVNR